MKKIALINSTRVEGFVFLILSLALFIYSMILHRLSNTEWKMSPYLFPLVISIFLAFLSLSLLKEGKQLKKENDREEGIASNWKDVIYIAIFTLVYCILIGVITFIPATSLFLLVSFWYLGERKRYLILLISLLFPVILYVLFGMLLHVMLP